MGVTGLSLLGAKKVSVRPVEGDRSEVVIGAGTPAPGRPPVYLGVTTGVVDGVPVTKRVLLGLTLTQEPGVSVSTLRL